MSSSNDVEIKINGSKKITIKICGSKIKINGTDVEATVGKGDGKGDKVEKEDKCIDEKGVGNKGKRDMNDKDNSDDEGNKDKKEDNIGECIGFAQLQDGRIDEKGEGTIPLLHTGSPKKHRIEKFTLYEKFPKGLQNKLHVDRTCSCIKGQSKVTCLEFDKIAEIDHERVCKQPKCLKAFVKLSATRSSLAEHSS